MGASQHRPMEVDKDKSLDKQTEIYEEVVVKLEKEVIDKVKKMDAIIFKIHVDYGYASSMINIQNLKNNFICKYDENCEGRASHIHKETCKAICKIHYKEIIDKNPEIQNTHEDIEKLLNEIESQSLFVEITMIRAKIYIAFILSNKEGLKLTDEEMKEIESFEKNLEFNCLVILDLLKASMTQSNTYELLKNTLSKLAKFFTDFEDMIMPRSDLLSLFVFNLSGKLLDIWVINTEYKGKLCISIEENNEESKIDELVSSLSLGSYQLKRMIHKVSVDSKFLSVFGGWSQDKATLAESLKLLQYKQEIYAKLKKNYSYSTCSESFVNMETSTMRSELINFIKYDLNETMGEKDELKYSNLDIMFQTGFTF